MLDKKDVLFRVSHRFYPTIRSGYDTYFGLNGPASIFISLGFGIRDNLSLSLGHANTKHEFELSLKWLPIEQGDWPFSFGLNGGGSLFTEPEPCEHVWRSENMKFNIQALISRQLSNSITIILVPGFSTNTNYGNPLSEDTFSLGVGGRFLLFDNLALIGEWVPVVDGYKQKTNSWGAGLDYKIGGHVFQVVITNAIGLTTDMYVSGGDLDIADNDYRLGFNIFRMFWF